MVFKEFGEFICRGRSVTISVNPVRFNSFCDIGNDLLPVLFGVK